MSNYIKMLHTFFSRKLIPMLASMNCLMTILKEKAIFGEPIEV